MVAVRSLRCRHSALARISFWARDSAPNRLRRQPMLEGSRRDFPAIRSLTAQQFVAKTGDAVDVIAWIGVHPQNCSIEA